MARLLSRRDALIGLGAIGSIGLLSACGAQQLKQINGVPARMVWSTYSVGTGTYNDFAAVANTFTSSEGIQVRLLSSDTGVGRLGPVIRDTAQYARTSVEYHYAFEGEDEFCSEVWGPQPIRLVWTPPGNYGILVRADSDVEKVEDLAGKRVPMVTASTAINRNIEAMLNYGGLTYDDIELVDIGYSEQTEGLKSGQIDVMYSNPTGSAVQELESEIGIRWLDFSDDDPKRFSTWNRLAPMVTTGPMEGMPGLEEGERITTLVYSLPVVSTTRRSAEEVHSYVSLLSENFDDFREATPDAENFSVDSILLTPLTIPFHEGTVRLLDEAGRWTPGLQKRQEALLDRESQLTEAWPDFWKKHAEDEQPTIAWKKWKKDNLPELPAVDDLTTERKDA